MTASCFGVDIAGILDGLAVGRPLFHSEADFQFALAWHLREKTGLDLRLEFKPFPKERIYLDIWLPSIDLAIELKYLTSELDVCAGNEFFGLREQPQDLGRYDFLKDVARLERVVAELPQASGGIALLLTNDPLYWDPSRRRANTDDAEFRIHEGRHLPKKMDWPDEKRAKKGKERESPIFLTGSYEPNWRDYGRRIAGAAKTKNDQFRYLAVEVRP